MNLFKKISKGSNKLFKKATSGANKLFKKDGVLDKASTAVIKGSGSVARVLRQGAEAGTRILDTVDRVSGGALAPYTGVARSALQGASNASEAIRAGRKELKDLKGDLKKKGYYKKGGNALEKAVVKQDEEDMITFE
jgi:hypothetical protein